MNNLPAEHYAARYMRQPWGGSASLAYRHLLAEINEELSNPQRRCPECEQPGIPILLAWPSRTRKVTTKQRASTRRRYLMCSYCGHRSVIHPGGGGAHNIFTQEQTDWICSMYEAGMPTRQIADSMHCAVNTIRNYLRNNAIPMRPRGGSEPLRGVPIEELEKIRLLYEVGNLSQKEIAERLGIHPSTVCTRIHRAGFQRGGVPIKGAVRIKR